MHSMFFCLCIFFTVGFAILFGYYLRAEDRTRGIVCAVLAVTFTGLTIIASYICFEHLGHGTPLTKSSLDTSVIYEIEAMTHLVFLRTKEKQPKVYYLRKTPPNRFIVIRNEKGELEFLSRPKPEKQPHPGIAKQPIN